MTIKQLPVIGQDGLIVGYTDAYIDPLETEALQNKAVADWQADNPRPADDDEKKLAGWNAKRQKLIDSVEPVYAVPASCTNKPIPQHDADVDDVVYIDEAWEVRKGAKADREKQAKEAEEAAKPKPEELLQRAKEEAIAKVRASRPDVLNALVGIALFSDDATTAKIAAIRTALLDLTKTDLSGCKTPDDVTAAFKKAWAGIAVSAAKAGVDKAFADVMS